MNTDCVRQIKLWILEHACKHGMETVIKRIMENERTTLFEVACHHPLNENYGLDPVFMFLLIIRKLCSALKDLMRNSSDSLACWHKNFLNLTIEILSTTYQQDAYISFKHFTNLLFRLKVMDVMRLLASGVSNNVVVENLNILLPRWSSAYEESIKKIYRIDNSVAVEKMKKIHISFRRFFLPLTVSDDCRKKYLMQSYLKDLRKFSRDCVLILSKVLDALQMKVGTTVIEKMFSDDTLANEYSADPTVQIFLEYINPKATESDFFNLLKALESNTFLSTVDGMVDCLGALDTLSDVGSEYNLDLSFSDDESLSDENIRETAKFLMCNGDSELSSVLPLTPTADMLNDDEDMEYRTDYFSANERSDDEIIAGTGDEVSNHSSCTSSQYPYIHSHLLHEDITPCVVKLFHRQVLCLGSAVYHLYS